MLEFTKPVSAFHDHLVIHGDVTFQLDDEQFESIKRIVAIAKSCAMTEARIDLPGAEWPEVDPDEAAMNEITRVECGELKLQFGATTRQLIDAYAVAMDKYSDAVVISEPITAEEIGLAAAA